MTDQDPTAQRERLESLANEPGAYIIVHRHNPDAPGWELVGRISPEQLEDGHMDKIAAHHGGGRFKFDARIKGQNGSVAKWEETYAARPPETDGENNEVLAQLEALKSNLAAAPSAQPSDSLMTTMMTGMFGLVTALVSQQQNPTSQAVEIAKVLKAETRPTSELLELVTIARELNGEGTSSRSVDGWAGTISEALAVVREAAAENRKTAVAQALARRRQNQTQPENAPERPQIASPASQNPPVSNDAEADERPETEPQASESAQIEEMIAPLWIILRAAANNPEPDPNKYADVIRDAIDADLLAAVLDETSDEELSATVRAQIPALTEPLVDELVAELRRGDEALTDESENQTAEPAIQEAA